MSSSFSFVATTVFLPEINSAPSTIFTMPAAVTKMNFSFSIRLSGKIPTILSFRLSKLLKLSSGWPLSFARQAGTSLIFTWCSRPVSVKM